MQVFLSRDHYNRNGPIDTFLSSVGNVSVVLKQVGLSGPRRATIHHPSGLRRGRRRRRCSRSSRSRTSTTTTIRRFLLLLLFQSLLLVFPVLLQWLFENALTGDYTDGRGHGDAEQGVAARPAKARFDSNGTQEPRPATASRHIDDGSVVVVFGSRGITRTKRLPWLVEKRTRFPEAAFLETSK